MIVFSLIDDTALSCLGISRICRDCKATETILLIFEDVIRK